VQERVKKGGKGKLCGVLAQGLPARYRSIEKPILWGMGVAAPDSNQSSLCSGQERVKKGGKGKLCGVLAQGLPARYRSIEKPILLG